MVRLQALKLLQRELLQGHPHQHPVAPSPLGLHGSHELKVVVDNRNQVFRDLWKKALSFCGEKD